jgi:Zn-dependent protease/predicted transcriptional regulator
MRSGPLGIPIARILGIEIRVQYSWVIVLALVAVIAVGQLNEVDPTLEAIEAWILGGIVALGFFASSVAHDLAHALVARRRGIDVQSIGVSFFGGSTSVDPSSQDPGDDAAIAASGPLASLALGGVLFGLMVAAIGIEGEFNAASGVLSVLIFLNLVLGLVNLVPAYPLDGGRLVRDIAWRRSGSERSGWRAASQSGRLTGLAMIGFGIVLFVARGDMTGALIALTGWFFLLSANTLRDRIRLDDLVGGRTVAEAMEPVTATVSRHLTVDTFAAQLLGGESPLTAVPVVEGDGVVGILGVGQVRRMRPAEWTTTRVEDVMVKPPKLTFLSPTDALKHGLERVYKAGVDGLPVMDGGRLLGVLTKRGVGLFIHGKSDGSTPGLRPPVPPTPPTMPGS